ncbi:alanine--tRNA ligase [Candidatus Nitronereus thalassa]|uniref:Alanine--tRNA ligase n=1 Tax=Candidatus Nitronereus thalassa TaxID=3020898 RepID=A0ABU3K3U8_9BACT|nr:alanine--tRNA ligase [Candidatus Nitronereus thalassa]MDT7041085.1 alanine--tRNA ligase [Candidatus Nitronereus thalassa]
MAMTAHELRQSFLDYFSKYDHAVVPSAPLIPQADPTLLFTNAGMNQFKRVFLGEETRSYKRAVSVQKCMRAGGKHNDLENVGYTRRHHTFFEMLGNFSFGDYFKEDAIFFGWDYLTKTIGLPQDKLWVTIFQDDDEAFELWQKKVNVPTNRIVRLGHKDNFWQMGDTGPCGPCSEIHIDQGKELGCGKPECAVGCDCDRYLEIWNLVFMQFDRDAEGTLHPLPKPSIDTGMGLERLAAVVQKTSSNYDSDLFLPLLSAIADRTRHTYGKDAVSDRSMRVIADHLRAITFMIADGILPSNEGRGYVLRRILRRASRHGRLLGTKEPFLHELTNAVIDQMKDVYGELSQAADVVRQAVEGEEERFIGTLDQGLPILNSMVDEAKAEIRGSLDGESVFKLYDTYGFPLDLIEEAAREQGLVTDLEGFQRALDAQRDRARKSASFAMEGEKPVVTELIQQLKPTEFLGYQALDADTVVQAILKNEQLADDAVEGDEVELVLNATPFYPEGGGQVGDQGTLVGPDGRIQVRDTTKVGGKLFLHKGKVTAGRVRKGEHLSASVNGVTRHDAARNHTATHLMHAALREILGPHVKQYGSLVTPNRLRFDFSHFKPLGTRDIEEIESLVNEQVRENTSVQTNEMGIQEATQAGALAFFGDKYGEKVRVVGIGEFSKELCGGTHCHATGEIGTFRIISEGGVAAGVRRIEALTGVGALDYSKKVESEVQELAELLKTSPSDVVTKARKLVSQLKDKERELEQLKLKMMDQGSSSAEADVRDINGVKVHVQRADGLSMQELRLFSDKVRNKVSEGVIALGSAADDKVSLLVIVTKDLSKKIKAGDLIKEMATEVDGSGGGRPDMAQAGGKNPAGLAKALDKVFSLVEAKL